MAFLGPLGTFSHQAAREQFGARSRADARRLDRRGLRRGRARARRLRHRAGGELDRRDGAGDARSLRRLAAHHQGRGAAARRAVPALARTATRTASAASSRIRSRSGSAAAGWRSTIPACRRSKLASNAQAAELASRDARVAAIAGRVAAEQLRPAESSRRTFRTWRTTARASWCSAATAWASRAATTRPRCCCRCRTRPARCTACSNRSPTIASASAPSSRGR